VAEQRISDAFAVQHPSGDDHPADRSVGGDPKEEPDARDVAELVDADGDRVDVDDGDVRSDRVDGVAVQPAGSGVDSFAHVGPVK
jgi:hypothetical protein